MFLALVCSALAAAAPGARAAASVVPAQSDAALLLDGSQGAVGLRTFLDAVAQRAPALGAGPRIAALVGPDLLGQPLAWGLAFSGPRALVLWRGSLALTAPVRDAKAARAALPEARPAQEWWRPSPDRSASSPLLDRTPQRWSRRSRRSARARRGRGRSPRNKRCAPLWLA